MVFGFVVNGEVGFASKGGLTRQARCAWQLVVADEQKRHVGLVLQLDRTGHTPVFELCSASHVVKIRYPVDAVVLIACRGKETGEYMWYYEMCSMAAVWGVPVVPVLVRINEMVQKQCFQSVSQLSDWVYHMQGKEGGVLVFRSGRMLKCKTAWWKSRQHEVERRLQSPQVVEFRKQCEGKEAKQKHRGKHKGVRAMVVGNIREGLSFYQSQCEGVHHMEGLVRGKGGVCSKIILIFEDEARRGGACRRAHLEGSKQCFRLIPSASNRIHSNEQVEVRKWFD